jgi:hypothetical protein
MKNHITNKKLFVTMAVLSVLMILLTEPMFMWLHNGAFNSLEEAILEPIFYWALGICVSTVIFLFLDNGIFQNWFKKVFIWYVPIGLLITFSTRVYGGIPQPGRVETASMLSALLVAITVVFVIVYFIYDWKKKK